MPQPRWAIISRRTSARACSARRRPLIGTSRSRRMPVCSSTASPCASRPPSAMPSPAPMNSRTLMPAGASKRCCTAPDPQPERLPLAGGAVGADAEVHGPAVGPGGAGGDRDQRGLARAVAPDEADDLALSHREVDAAQHPAVPMGLGQSLDAEALCLGSLGLLAPQGPLDGPPRISGPDALPPALDHGRRSTPDRRMAPRRVDSARFVAAPYLT